MQAIICLKFYISFSKQYITEVKIDKKENKKYY